VISRIQEISGKKVSFYPYDVSDELELEKIFQRHTIECVIHFAGKKAANESVLIPLDYYRTNLNTTISLCRVMQRYHVRKFVFSSSAAIYGISDNVPFAEDSPHGACSSPFGWTKCMNEQILRDLCLSDSTWSVQILRYFNPVGAHSSGRIGEDPRGTSDNLMMNITQVAAGKIKKLSIYGADYPTPDGTGIRDYIHVMDLAEGHVAAVKKCISDNGIHVYNLGTGIGYSVFDMLHAFEKTIGRTLPFEIVPRRDGDVAKCFAMTKKAEDELGWKSVRNLQEMCNDSWKWYSDNLNGYE
jgi:UDP-glucose 4-epimerase